MSKSVPLLKAPVVPTLTMREERHITCGERPGVAANDECQPRFRFGGKYLKKYGFFVGTKVTIHLQRNKITLTASGRQQWPASKLIKTLGKKQKN